MLERRVQGIRVLVVEDDDALREALRDTLEIAGADVSDAADGAAALRILGQSRIDIVVSDVNMPGMDGHELLRHVREHHPQVPMLLMTAFGSIERSVSAMRDGAVDYLVKPFQPAALVDSIARFAVGSLPDEDEPVAVADGAVELLRLARRVAATDSTVLLSGESGTGKEVLARYIHRHSPRVGGPFIAINCAAIPENMLEALLFGHEKGAFTGAHASMPGKFELADRGTLLLDEISEMHISLQAKLLRVLQEREVERLGARKPTVVDVRVIATSNRDLLKEVADGRFREDLYYRLSVFPLHCLPLRDRPADIVPLANRLAREHAVRMHHVAVRFDASALRAMTAHRWPGNVRELENVVQRALIMQSGPVVGAVDLRLDPQACVPRPVAQPDSAAAVAPDADAASSLPDEAGRLNGDLRLREFQIIVNTIKDARGSRSTAAERLGISARTLRYKLAKLRESGMDVEAALMRG